MISVIIPAYNAEKYLKKTIESVLHQKNITLEMIVVNDGSTDDTPIILQAYPQVKVITQNNQGTFAARNAGLDVASGEFIYFLDADDILFPGALRKMEREIHGFDLLAADYSVLDENGKILIDHASPFIPCTLDQFAYAPSCLSGKLFRKEIIDQFGIQFQNFRIAEDLNFYLKYLSVSQSAAFFDHPVFGYRSNPNSISHQVDETVFQLMDAINDAANFGTKYERKNFAEMIPSVILAHARTQFMKYRETENKLLKKKIFDYFGGIALEQNPEPMSDYLRDCKKCVEKQKKHRWFYLYVR